MKVNSERAVLHTTDARLINDKTTIPDHSEATFVSSFSLRYVKPGILSFKQFKINLKEDINSIKTTRLALEA